MKVRMCEIVQQVEYFDLDSLQKVLHDKKCIVEWAYILHNNDKKEDGSPVVPHIHLALKFDNSYDSKYICKWFNVPEQCVNKIKGKWVDILKYLTHKNSLDKYQYSDEDVVCNFDYSKALEGAVKNVDKRKVEIMEKIVSGEIREYNYYDYMSIEEYDKYRKNIDNAFRYRIDKIKGVEREMECVFITGDSGTGKTTYAKKVADDRGFSVFVSSGSNDPLDDYKGQDCIILDDLRPSCMGLSDLLKMLDNHTASSVKSRYKNKVLECKLVIITTTLDIDTFFSNVFSEERETIIQLKRRCSLMLKFRMDEIDSYLYNPYKRDYEFLAVMPNPIYLEYSLGNKELSRAEQLRKMASVLGMTADVVDKLNSDSTKRILESNQVDWDDI